MRFTKSLALSIYATSRAVRPALRGFVRVWPLTGVILVEVVFLGIIVLKDTSTWTNPMCTGGDWAGFGRD